MNQHNHPIPNSALVRARPIIAAFLATLLSLPANAGITLPYEPLQSSGRIAPNILFILDDSGSMQNNYMPDAVPNLTLLPDIGGLRAARYAYTRNTIYYNPAVSYTPWLDSTGAQMTGGTSYNDAYSSTDFLTGSVNLQNNIQTFFVPIDPSNTTDAYLDDGSNYYRYQIHTDGRIVRSQYAYNVTGNEGGATGRGCSSTGGPSWRWKYCEYALPSGRSEAEERTNFATWYSYNRTRMKVAKSGAGQAFGDLGKDVRVGFRTIWRRNQTGNPVTHTTPILVNRNDGLFDDPNGVGGAYNNRTLWYQRLYNASGSDTTPLHSALTDAGNYYKETGTSGPYGPQSGTSQYACRQNFTILTTDGYWNGKSNYTDVANEQDNLAGPTMTSPTGDSYAYTPTRPYSASASDTLADVAMRYWKSDLRTDLDNIVPTTSSNPAFWQHMVTFGISIGEKGTLNPETDLPAITAGTLNWPTPVNNTIVNIDDLWHASVNGRGKFLVASNPDDFATGLKAALATIIERTGSFSNLSANSTQINTGTRLFQASFVSGVWTGQLKSFPVTSAGASDVSDWNASAGIPTTGRNIFTHDGTGGAVFPTAAQVTALARTDAPAVSGADNAAYIAGTRTLELSNTGGTLRNRNHLLGDIVNSAPAFDERTNTVYVGANDGMLHAINSANGAERFTYVPAGLNFTDLATLSKPDYAHRYFVDGPIVISSPSQTPGSSVLVGTLGRGGKGLFALDVTTPGSFAASNVKWERTTTPGNNMGLVLGQPIIAKLNNGEMGLIVPNGLNSQNDRAVLLVYRLNDGQLLAEIDTGAGSALAPNGLSAPTTRDVDGNGTVDYVYAGDMLGNMWKFNLSSASPTAWNNTSNRLRMFTAVNAAGQVQPITSAPSVARDPATYLLWVFFGTGRFLTVGDIANTEIQTLYGIKDVTATITSRSTELQQRRIIVTSTVNGRGARGFDSPAALPVAMKGWYIDLVDPPAPPGTAVGERIVSDPQVISNVLITSSILPSSDPCLPGGSGYLNALDAFTGTSLDSSFFDLDEAGSFDDEVILAGSGPPGSTVAVGSLALGGMGTMGNLFTGGGGGGGGLICLNISDASIECERIRELRKTGRVSWREIIRD
jgi:type IV pilus assembly protein PilY1